MYHIKPFNNTFVCPVCSKPYDKIKSLRYHCKAKHDAKVTLIAALSAEEKRKKNADKVANWRIKNKDSSKKKRR